MSFGNVSEQMRQLLLGNISLIACAVFYLAWWVIAFRPNGGHNWVSTCLLILAFIAGMVGLANMVLAIRHSTYEKAFISEKVLLWGGILVYIIALLITYYLLKRQVTSELFLIIGWAVLEISAINVLYGSGRFSIDTAVVLGIIIGVAVVVSLVCYVLYYRLSGTASYIDGMIPLMLEAAVMAGLIIKALD